ncbi:hypothetical protein R6Q57_018541 [Mikania cordata]
MAEVDKKRNDVGVRRNKKEVMGGAHIVQSHLANHIFMFQKLISLEKKVTEAHSTITREAGLMVNPNCEPYVPTGSLEQVSTTSSPGQNDCDVKPFDPQEFYQKVCFYACGILRHIA